MESDDILFIYDNKPGSRKQARKHVSKVVRQREHRQRARDPFIPEKFTNRICSYSKDKKTQARISAETLNSTAVKSISKDSDGVKIGQPGDVAFNKSDKADNGDAYTKINGGCMLYVPTRPQYHYSTVDSYFSAARSDPFCTLPIALDLESAKCLDHFNTSMPFLEFCVYEGAPLIPSRHVAFRSALETPAALHAIIATGATHLASLYGVETTLIIQHHVGQALEILRRELLTVSKFNWSRIAQTMTEIAAGDEFRGRIQNSCVHLNGLRELMGHFGGISKLEATPKVQLLVCYVLNGCTAAYFPIIHCTRGTFDKLRSLLCPPKRQFSNPFKAADLLPLGLNKSQRRILFDVSLHVYDFCRFMEKLRPSTNTTVPTTKSETFRTTQTPNPTITRIQRLLPQYLPAENKILRRLSISTLDGERFGGLGPKGHHRVSCLITIVMALVGLSEAEDMQGLILYLERLGFWGEKNLRLLQFLLLMEGREISMGGAEAQVRGSKGVVEVRGRRDKDHVRKREGNSAKESWEVVRAMQVYKMLGEEYRGWIDDALVGVLTGSGTGTEPGTEFGARVRTDVDVDVDTDATTTSTSTASTVANARTTTNTHMEAKATVTEEAAGETKGVPTQNGDFGHSVGNHGGCGNHTSCTRNGNSFGVYEVMNEVLRNLVQVIGEKPLLGSTHGATDELDSSPTEDIRGFFGAIPEL